MKIFEIMKIKPSGCKIFLNLQNFENHDGGFLNRTKTNKLCKSNRWFFFQIKNKLSNLETQPMGLSNLKKY